MSRLPPDEDAPVKEALSGVLSEMDMQFKLPEEYSKYNDTISELCEWHAMFPHLRNVDGEETDTNVSTTLSCFLDELVETRASEEELAFAATLKEEDNMVNKCIFFI